MILLNRENQHLIHNVYRNLFNNEINQETLKKLTYNMNLYNQVLKDLSELEKEKDFLRRTTFLSQYYGSYYEYEQALEEQTKLRNRPNIEEYQQDLTNSLEQFKSHYSSLVNCLSPINYDRKQLKKSLSEQLTNEIIDADFRLVIVELLLISFEIEYNILESYKYLGMILYLELAKQDFNFNMINQVEVKIQVENQQKLIEHNRIRIKIINNLINGYKNKGLYNEKIKPSLSYYLTAINTSTVILNNYVSNDIKKNDINDYKKIVQEFNYNCSNDDMAFLINTLFESVSQHTNIHTLKLEDQSIVKTLSVLH